MGLRRVFLIRCCSSVDPGEAVGYPLFSPRGVARTDGVDGHAICAK